MLTLAEAERLANVVIDSGLFPNFQGVETDRKATDRAHARAVVHLLFADQLGLPALDGLTGLLIAPDRRRIDTRHLAALVQRSGRYRYRYVVWRADLVHLEWLERDEFAAERWWVRCGTGCQAQPRDERLRFGRGETWSCDGCESTQLVETLVPAGWVLAGDTRWDLERAEREGRTEKDPGNVWGRFPRGCLTAAALREGQAAFCPDLLHLGFRAYDDSPEQEPPEAAEQLGAARDPAPPRFDPPRDSITLEHLRREVRARSCTRGLPASGELEGPKGEDVVRFRWASGEWLAWRYSARASKDGEARYMPLDAWPVGPADGKGVDPDELAERAGWCVLHAAPRARCTCPHMEEVLRALFEAAGRAMVARTAELQNMRAAGESEAAARPSGSLPEGSSTAGGLCVTPAAADGAVPPAAPSTDGAAQVVAPPADEETFSSDPQPADAPSSDAAKSEGAPATGAGEVPAPASSNADPSPSTHGVPPAEAGEESSGGGAPTPPPGLHDASGPGTKQPDAAAEPGQAGPGPCDEGDGAGGASPPPPALPDDGPTLTEALAARGLRHRPSCKGAHLGLGRRDVLQGDYVVLEHVTAAEVWAWLKDHDDGIEGGDPDEDDPALMPDVQGLPEEDAQEDEEAPDLPDDDWGEVEERPQLGRPVLARAPAPTTAATLTEAEQRKDRAARWKKRPSHKAKAHDIGACVECGEQVDPGDLYHRGVEPDPKDPARRLSKRGQPIGVAHALCIEDLAKGIDPRAEEATA